MRGAPWRARRGLAAARILKPTWRHADSVAMLFGVRGRTARPSPCRPGEPHRPLDSYPSSSRAPPVRGGVALHATRHNRCHVFGAVLAGPDVRGGSHVLRARLSFLPSLRVTGSGTRAQLRASVICARVSVMIRYGDATVPNLSLCPLSSWWLPSAVLSFAKTKCDGTRPTKARLDGLVLRASTRSPWSD